MPSLTEPMTEDAMQEFEAYCDALWGLTAAKPYFSQQWFDDAVAELDRVFDGKGVSQGQQQLNLTTKSDDDFWRTL